jgi:hypothetical protein
MEVTFEDLFSSCVVAETQKTSHKAHRIAKLLKNFRERTLDHIGGSRVAITTAALTMATIGMFGSALHETVEEVRFQKDKFLGTDHVNNVANKAGDILRGSGINNRTSQHVLSLQNVSPLRDGSTLVEVAPSTEGMTCSSVLDAARQATNDQDRNASVSTILERGIEAQTGTQVVIEFWQGRTVCQRP